MPFKQGDKNINRIGRPNGKLNRSTEQAKLTIARVANQGLNNISEDLEEIRKKDPIEAAKLYLRLLEYIIPKQKAIEMRAEIDQRIHQITINVNRSGQDEPND